MKEDEVKEVGTILFTPEIQNEVFANIDDRSLTGTHWTSLYLEDKKSYFLVLFGRPPDNSLLDELPKPLSYHRFDDQTFNSRFFGTFCLYFYLIELMENYDVV